MARARSTAKRGEVVRLPAAGRRRGGAAPLLLRLPVTSPTWAESLPPTPVGCFVTAAFSDADVEAEHADAVALLGYHVVGTFPAAPGTPPSVDLLMSRDACDRWPRWRDELLAAGGQVWDLSFGPVAMRLGAAVEVHDRPA